jgi:hypothetical protein
LSLIKRLIRVLAADTDLWDDPVWIVDSTPVERARFAPGCDCRASPAGRLRLLRLELTAFLGLRLHLLCAPAGLRSPGRWRTRNSTNARCWWL